MADGPIGRSDPMIRPLGVVERPGSATDRRSRRERQPDRRGDDPDNAKRRRLYDLLFDEVDRLGRLDERQKSRVKDNIREHLTTPVPAEPPPAHHGSPYPHEYRRDQPAEEPAAPLDAERIVEVAAPLHPQLSPEEAEENARLARQLRACLAEHTEAARKLAVYLHLLIGMSGAQRPRVLVLDV